MYRIYSNTARGLKLNPVSNWTWVNLWIQIEKFKSF